MNIISFEKIKSKRKIALSDFLNLGILSDKVFLAGGALRSLVDKDDIIDDYDLFFADLESAKQTKIKLESLGFELIYSCPSEYLFTYKKNNVKIQVICEYFFKNPAEVIGNFDFTVACVATDGVSLFFISDFVRHVRKKELHLNKLIFPVATLRRIIKYEKKGYKIKYVAEEFVKEVSGNSYVDADLRWYID